MARDGFDGASVSQRQRQRERAQRQRVGARRRWLAAIVIVEHRWATGGAPATREAAGCPATASAVGGADPCRFPAPAARPPRLCREPRGQPLVHRRPVCRRLRGTSPKAGCVCHALAASALPSRHRARSAGAPQRRAPTCWALSDARSRQPAAKHGRSGECADGRHGWARRSLRCNNRGPRGHRHVLMRSKI